MNFLTMKNANLYFCLLQAVIQVVEHLDIDKLNYRIGLSRVSVPCFYEVHFSLMLQVQNCQGSHRL